MHAVITGDIVNSRSAHSEAWITSLKSVLNDYGTCPKDWDIYRGDSFQLLIDNVEESLMAAIRIKASIKTRKWQDARMAIGIGDISYTSDRVTESNGDAFVRSGQKFESLKQQKVTLSVGSPWKDFDDEMNLYVRLALIAIDGWSVASAEFVLVQLANMEKSQDELAALLHIGQPAVSERKKRAYFDEIIELETRFRNRVRRLM